MSKYNAKKVIVTPDGTLFEEELVKKYKLSIDGIRFDSKMEGEYYQELLWLIKDGTLTKVECHPSFVLQDKPKITYIADFKLTFANGEQTIVDIKGVETAAFRLKKKLFAAKYPDLSLQILGRMRGEWLPVEEIKRRKANRSMRNGNILLKQMKTKKER
jgi:Protein of unknown function (DUF1064).